VLALLRQDFLDPVRSFHRLPLLAHVPGLATRFAPTLPARRAAAALRPLSRPRKEAWKNWWNSSCARPVAAPDRRFAFRRRRSVFRRRRFVDPVRLPAYGVSQSHAAAARVAVEVLFPTRWLRLRTTTCPSLLVACTSRGSRIYSPYAKLFCEKCPEKNAYRYLNCRKNKGVNRCNECLSTAAFCSGGGNDDIPEHNSGGLDRHTYTPLQV
jgi:hypothetical protein